MLEKIFEKSILGSSLVRAATIFNLAGIIKANQLFEGVIKTLFDLEHLQ